MTVVVAFLSRKGGVGKSTMARALCAVAARKGLKTKLADLDPAQRTASRWQRLRDRNLVLPSISVAAFDNADSAVATSSDADLLIIDGPGQNLELTAEIASVAHTVVQPCGACFDDLQPAMELFYNLANAGVPKARLQIALSRLSEPDEETAARAYVDVAGFSVLPGAIMDHARYREAHNRGLAFIEIPGEDLTASAGHLLGALLTRVLDKHRLLQAAATATRENAPVLKYPAPFAPPPPQPAYC
ncbi:ParA family protein [Hyphomicrobium sp. D-2]|uniref:ParA family protein n=1 Tax=Hyphomicrobium sp. D-2 TaxID=3041621 RepID=UPI0024580AF7|nr:ParA family protein [Hyphomicrobium sp. D-2]MDH4982873.1 ParA family protein [Hyphomicrobium sp. D-2]